MSEQELLENAGPKFFGKMCAGISHEIKNNLAIIGQQCGLIEDLLSMAEQGRGLDSARLKKLSQGIAQQVKRADDVIKRLNRFAHSVDDVYAAVDLGEVLSLIIALCQRFASVRGVQLEMETPGDRVDVLTSPFVLEHLLFLCIDSAVAGSENGSRLLMKLESTGSAAVLTFSSFPPAGFGPDELQQKVSSELLRRLEAQISANREAGELTVRLPKALSSAGASTRT